MDKVAQFQICTLPVSPPDKADDLSVKPDHPTKFLQLTNTGLA